MYGLESICHVPFVPVQYTPFIANRKIIHRYVIHTEISIENDLDRRSPRREI